MHGVGDQEPRRVKLRVAAQRRGRGLIAEIGEDEPEILLGWVAANAHASGQALVFAGLLDALP